MIFVAFALWIAVGCAVVWTCKPVSAGPVEVLLWPAILFFALRNGDGQ